MKPIASKVITIDGKNYYISLFQKKSNQLLTYYAILHLDSEPFIFKDENQVPYYFTDQDELILYATKLIESKIF